MAATYSTWEYYSTTYHGQLDVNTYRRLSIQAAGEINRHTFGRAKTAPETMQAALCLCECELVDALNTFAQSYALLPRGISSINNDGFSASTNSGNSRKDSREANQAAEIHDICSKHLLEPVNLLYAGVARC